MGTELHARGVPTPLPGWSSHALEAAPDIVRAIHRDYAKSGAQVHTTNTFRTRAATYPARWERLARLAVRLARESVPSTHLVAGSIAPLQDCYRPELSPADREPEETRAEHRALALALADEGCDLLLCETFPHMGEALLAAQAAIETGLETWVSFTPGPNLDLLTPEQVGEGAETVLRSGAKAVLVNCLPSSKTLPYLQALAPVAKHYDADFGAYTNVGWVDDVDGWKPAPNDPEEFAQEARPWIEVGATILGGCCGTGPAHVRALRDCLKGR